MFSVITFKNILVRISSICQFSNPYPFGFNLTVWQDCRQRWMVWGSKTRETYWIFKRQSTWILLHLWKPVKNLCTLVNGTGLLPNDCNKLAFRTKYRLSELVAIPFGTCNSPANEWFILSCMDSNGWHFWHILMTSLCLEFHWQPSTQP